MSALAAVASAATSEEYGALPTQAELDAIWSRLADVRELAAQDGTEWIKYLICRWIIDKRGASLEDVGRIGAWIYEMRTLLDDVRHDLNVIEKATMSQLADFATNGSYSSEPIFDRWGRPRFGEVRELQLAIFGDRDDA